MTLATRQDDCTRHIIIDTLWTCNWVKHATAKRLDIDRTTLRRLMKKHGIPPNKADYESALYATRGGY